MKQAQTQLAQEHISVCVRLCEGPGLCVFACKCIGRLSPFPT